MNLFLLMCKLYFSQKIIGKFGMDDTLRKQREHVSLETIIQSNENKKLLDFLQTNTTSDQEKLDEIYRQRYPTIFNILNGGLMKDWEFDFDSIEHYHP